MFNFLSSPQTTVTGIVNLMMAGFMFWQGHQSEAMVAAAAGLQGLFARDNGTSSEQAGAK